METSLSWLGRLATAPNGPDWQRLGKVYGPLLASWLARAGVPVCERDDLIQEVMMVVVRRVSEFEHRGPGAFRAWLRGILTYHIRKFFRERQSHPAIDLDQLAGADTELSRIWDRDHDAYLAARAMNAVQGDFAPTTWAAFRRQVFDGLKPSAVAIELDLTLNAVLLAKSRVLKRLREELNGLIE